MPQAEGLATTLAAGVEEKMLPLGSHVLEHDATARDKVCSLRRAYINQLVSVGKDKWLGENVLGDGWWYSVYSLFPLSRLFRMKHVRHTVRRRMG